MLKRELYLSKIRKFYHMDLVKIITGIKRCGKSTLLTQIEEELLAEGVLPHRIIVLNFEDDIGIHSLAELLEYLAVRMTQEEKFYVFLDEVQLLEDFESAIKAMRRLYHVSIFLTSSNSSLLSDSFLTMLLGQYTCFQMYPFSFQEMCEYKKIKSSQITEKTLEEYISMGGLPLQFEMENSKQCKTIIRDIYSAIILQEMIQIGGIKDIELFHSIMKYHIKHVSEVFSLTELMEYISGTDRKVSKATIYSYIELMNSSYLTLRAQRYDIRDNRVLTKMDKYYLAGAGMEVIYTPACPVSKMAMLENTIYIELLRRGYKVYVGKNRSAEVDFVAVKGLQKEYYQVIDAALPLKEKENEYQILKDIPDYYPKYVISLASDSDVKSDVTEGITFINAIKFLLME